MREACLYNNWSFVPIFLKIYRALMRWTPWGFLGDVAMMSPHDGGTHLEWGVEGRGMTALSQILSDESLSYSLKHISKGEHSLHISWRGTHLLHLYFLFSWQRHQMETCSASLAFVRRIHRWLRGIHWSSVTQTSDTELWCFLWTNGWVNNQDAGGLRRHRAHYDVERRKISRLPGSLSMHYGRNGLKFGTLLYPDYHSLKLTIYFALSGSLSLWCQIIHKLVLSWGGNKINIHVRSLYKNEWPACNAYYRYHPQCLLYSRDGCKRRSSYAYHTWQQSYSLYAYLSARDQLCVCQKLPARNNATIVINACNHRQCWKSKWCNHRQGHIFLSPLLHRMVIK